MVVFQANVSTCTHDLLVTECLLCLWFPPSQGAITGVLNTGISYKRGESCLGNYLQRGVEPEKVHSGSFRGITFRV